MGAIDEKSQTKPQSSFDELLTEPNFGSPSDSNASAASKLSQASLPPSKKKAVAKLNAFSPYVLTTSFVTAMPLIILF